MATIVVSNTGGNWNSSTTWVGGVVPSSGDDVTTTASSGPLTVTANTSCKSLILTGYTNTFTVNSGIVLTISGNTTFSSGMTLSGTGALSIIETSTLTSAGKTWTGDLRFGGTSKVFTLNDNWTILGTIRFFGVTLSTLNGNTLTAGGGLNHTTTATVEGTTSIVLNGTGILNTPGGGVLRINITINTLGTITISGVFYFSDKTFTHIQGTVITTGSRIVVNPTSSATTFNCSGMTWDNFFHTGLQNIQLLNDINLNNLTGNTSTISVGFSGLNRNVNVYGNFTISNSATYGYGNSAAVVLKGTGTWSHTTAGIVISPLIIDTAGTINISGSVYFRGSTLTYVNGTVNTSGSTLWINSGPGSTILNTSGSTSTSPSTTSSTGINFNNVITGGVVDITSTLCVVNTLNLSTNTNLSNSGQTIYLNGSLTVSSNSLGVTPIIMQGTGTWSGNFELRSPLTFNTLGTITVSGSVKYAQGTLTYVSGNMVTTGSTITVGVSSTTSGGTLNTSGMSWNNLSFQGPAGVTFNLLSDLNVLGDLVTIGTINGSYNVNAFKSCLINTTYGGIKIIMKGTGTLYTQGLSYCFVNVDINTTGTTTIGNIFNFYEGDLNYVSGNVVTTNSNLFLRLSNAKNINTNGIEWNNVEIAGSGQPNFSSTFTCKNLEVGSGSFVLLNGSDVFVKGNLTNNNQSGGSVGGSSTVYLIGNGTWSDTSAGYISFDLVINTTGTTTIVGTTKYSLGTLTFSSGTFVSSGGTLALGSLNTADTNVLNQIPGLTITNVSLNGNTSFGGNQNITINNLNSSNTSTTRTINFSTGNTVTVTSGLTLSGTFTTPILFKSSTTNVKAKFIHSGSNFSNQDVGYTNATDIDSSGGLPIWSYNATLSNTINWNRLIPPASSVSVS